ncbi:hypothetical protein P8452_46811 [Trifolium repens]|nr:hypothetical protein P8452_46811 [Trifolium repens]
MSARLIVSSPVMTLSPLSPAFNFGIMDHSHSCRVYYEYYPQPLDQSSSFSTRCDQQIIAFAQLAATNCSIWTSVNTRDYNRYAKRLKLLDQDESIKPTSDRRLIKGYGENFSNTYFC